MRKQRFALLLSFARALYWVGVCHSKAAQGSIRVKDLRRLIYLIHFPSLDEVQAVRSATHSLLVETHVVR